MVDFLLKLFDTRDFPARGHCGRWTDGHGWLHIGSDLAIFGAYIAIPIVLGYFVLRKRDVPFQRIFILFAVFIVACGSTHLLEAIIFWKPVYRLSGTVKFVTALASWGTVLALVPVVPKALALQSPEALAREVERRTAELKQSRMELHQTNLALQAKNEELEQFVFTVSHDLKSPLVTSSGFLDALQEDLKLGDSVGVADAVARLERANRRMTLLTDDLLQLSRVGRVKGQPVMLEARAVIKEATDELSELLKEAQAKVEVAPDLPGIYADHKQLVQVIQNLVTNAIKHACREPGRTIHIGGYADADATGLFVRDSGPGIDPRDQQRIFELFERSNTEVPGTGVGLTIVAKIAKVHGGKAWVESKLGDGATFWVTFRHPDSL